MTKKVFIDSDIILDLALFRAPWVHYSKHVLALAENGLIQGLTSLNCVANIHYILKKVRGESDTRFFISQILRYISVLSMDHRTVLEALESDFTDFEDALQYGAAQRNQCDCIVTRNIGDYKTAQMDVQTPEEFLRLLG
ncbi:MAG: PIN domain-containing protein [Treponema sp.]|jgi:predicted nucleic acid-binding protein|nr:PIN domain-containing protein [Treponema sp.]